MRAFLTFAALAIALTPLAGCGKKEPKVAGDLTQTNICQTTGYLIRSALGTNIRTASVPCSVRNIGGNTVEIRSGYISPLNPNTLNYTAHGTVRGTTLMLDTIQVHGIDSTPIPFHKFPG